MRVFHYGLCRWRAAEVLRKKVVNLVCGAVWHGMTAGVFNPLAA